MKNKLLSLIKRADILLLVVLLSAGSLNAQVIAQATGGINISLDKSSAAVSPAFAALGGPIVTEDNPGQFVVSDYYLFVSTGWKFDTSQPVSISISGGGGTFALSSYSVIPTAQLIVFHVSAVSKNQSATLTFSNVRIQPTGTTPSTDFLKSTMKNNANFGDLSSVVGSERAFKITAASSNPTAGTTNQLSISVVDQFQNVITSSTGNKDLVFSGLGTAPNGTSVPTVTNLSGTSIAFGSATTIHFTSGVSDAGGLLTAYKAEGPVTLNASSGTISSTAAGGSGSSLTISSGGVDYSASKISVSQSVIAPGSTSLVTLQATDVYGNNLSTGGATIAFSQSTGIGESNGTFSAVTDNGKGKYNSTFTGVTEGTPTTISATYNTNPITSTLPTIRVVTAGVAKSYRITAAAGTPTAGVADQLTISIVDSNQVIVTSFTGNKTITFSGLGTAPDGTSTPTITNYGGLATALGTATVIHFTSGVSDAGALLRAYKAEGPVTLNATDGTLSTTTAGGSGVSLTILPGTINYSKTSVTVSKAAINPDSTSTVTLQAKDSYANNIKTGGATVAFSATGGTSTGTFNAVTDHSNGTYTSVFTGTAPGTALTINATYNGNNITSTMPTITVAPSIISAATSTVTVSAATVTAGAYITITLQAKNAAGTNLATGGGNVAFSYKGGTSTGVVSTVTDHNNGTYTATFTGNIAGTATTIIATVAGDTVRTTMPTVTVTYGAISYLKAVPALSTMVTGTTNEITLTACDLYGNTVKSYAGAKTITFTGLQGTETIESSINSVTVNFTDGVSAAGALTFQAQVARNTFINFSDGTYGTSADISYAAHIIITAAVPGAPVATTATAITSSGFTANWIPPVGATGFFVDVATDTSFNLPVSGYINLNVGNVTFVQVTGLTGNIKYYYRVRASNAGGTSANSNIVSVTTLVNIPNSPVANAATNINSNDFTANWAASANATGYFLDVATDNLFTLPVSGYIGKNVANATMYKVTGLNPTTTYYYRVRAYNSQGESGNSNIIIVSTITGVEELNNDMPTTFQLYQNYPNPFNPTTKIQFAIPKAAMVKLSVYNILGQEITTLLNRELSQGTYSVKFDASKLNNGIYIYRIQAGDPSQGSGQSFTQTKKMILLK